MRVIPGKILQRYIDDSIRRLRSQIAEIRSLRRGSMFPNMESTEELKAIYTIDALQDIRKQFLGSTLPEE